MTTRQGGFVALAALHQWGTIHNPQITTKCEFKEGGAKENCPIDVTEVFLLLSALKRAIASEKAFVSYTKATM